MDIHGQEAKLRWFVSLPPPSKSPKKSWDLQALEIMPSTVTAQATVHREGEIEILPKVTLSEAREKFEGS